MKGLYVLDQNSFDLLYGPAERDAIAERVEIYGPLQTAEMLKENPAILQEAEAIFSGWGCPVLGEELLQTAPNLKVVFYAAGSIKYFVTEAFWQRGIQISSGWVAMGIPVVEYSLAQILYGLKSGYQQALNCRKERAFARLPAAGAFGSTVGLISLGSIGRMLADRLKTFEVNIIAYDPYVPAYPGVTMVSLNEVFQRADVVSLHTPWLKETEGMIRGAHLAMMKRFSTFINTARGAVVREVEMIEVLRQRPDLMAVLDVTYPEPPVPESPLYDLPNVILTPHIAGPVGLECHRQGQYMLAELKHYQAGEPLQYGLTREQVRIMA